MLEHMSLQYRTVCFSNACGFTFPQLKNKQTDKKLLFIFLSVLKDPNNTLGAWIAQLVECPTEKPGAILTQVRVPGATRDFSPSVNFQCRLTVSIQPPCSLTRINICEHVTNGTIFWTQENTTHTAENG